MISTLIEIRPDSNGRPCEIKKITDKWGSFGYYVRYQGQKMYWDGRGGKVAVKTLAAARKRIDNAPNKYCF
jgi:hypothetical protein